jgi:hypothetical protein
VLIPAAGVFMTDGGGGSQPQTSDFGCPAPKSGNVANAKAEELQQTNYEQACRASFLDTWIQREEERQDAAAEERSFLGHFFLGEAGSKDHLAAEKEKRRRREEQDAAYRKALREKKERRDELRKVFMAQPTPLFIKPDLRDYMIPRGRSSYPVSASVLKEEEEECVDLEPFFFDEAEVVVEYEAAAGKRQEEQKQREEEEMRSRRLKFHTSVLDSIRDYNHKTKSFYFRRVDNFDLSTFDLDEECKPLLSSPLSVILFPLAKAPQLQNNLFSYCKLIRFSFQIPRALESN